MTRRIRITTLRGLLVAIAAHHTNGVGPHQPGGWCPCGRHLCTKAGPLKPTDLKPARR